MRTALDFGGGLGFAVFHRGSASPARAGPPGRCLRARPSGRDTVSHRGHGHSFQGRSAMTPLAGAHHG
jgi:hypothetical protein